MYYRHIYKAIMVRSKTLGYWWVVDYRSGRRVKYVNRTPASVTAMLYACNFAELKKHGFREGVWYYG